jgi:hypothetical protein
METNQDQESEIKETFIIRSEWWGSISELSEKGKAIFLEWIFCYHLNKPIENKNDEINREVRMIWNLIEPNLKYNIAYYDKRRETSKVNGKKGGRPISTNNLNNLTEPKKTLTDIDTVIATEIEIETKSENDNLKTLSHFDFLNFKFNKEVLALVTEYKPKIEDWDMLVKKFNLKKVDQFGVVHFESYIDKWIKNNNSNSSNFNQNEKDIKQAQSTRKIFTGYEEPKKKIGGI